MLLIMKARETIITNYIAGYNSFDINKMLADVSHNVVFENISQGETTMRLEGLGAFRQQAEQAKALFTQREQCITSFDHDNNATEIGISYKATLAMDLPNGMKKGDVLELKGKSVFRFADHKITAITDIS